MVCIEVNPQLFNTCLRLYLYLFVIDIDIFVNCNWVDTGWQ